MKNNIEVNISMTKFWKKPHGLTVLWFLSKFYSPAYFAIRDAIIVALSDGKQSNIDSQYVIVSFQTFGTHSKYKDLALSISLCLEISFACSLILEKSIFSKVNIYKHLGGIYIFIDCKAL
jgi:hypothetical protein